MLLTRRFDLRLRLPEVETEPATKFSLPGTHNGSLMNTDAFPSGHPPSPFSVYIRAVCLEFSLQIFAILKTFRGEMSGEGNFPLPAKCASLLASDTSCQQRSKGQGRQQEAGPLGFPWHSFLYNFRCSSSANCLSSLNCGQK